MLDLFITISFAIVIIGAFIIPGKIKIKENTERERLIVIGILIIELLFYLVGMILLAKWFLRGSSSLSNLGSEIQEAGLFTLTSILSLLLLINLIIWAIKMLKEK